MYWWKLPTMVLALKKNTCSGSLKDFTARILHEAGIKEVPGLGLAICKHIIEAHGQAIHVRSTPDVGTSIGFTLESRKD